LHAVRDLRILDREVLAAAPWSVGFRIGLSPVAKPASAPLKPQPHGNPNCVILGPGAVGLDMSQRSGASSAHAIVPKVVCVLVLAALLAGCDRCGDLWRPIKFESQTCRDEAPRPQ